MKMLQEMNSSNNNNQGNRPQPQLHPQLHHHHHLLPNHPDHPDHPTRLSSTAWGPLPAEVVAWYASKGVTRFFPWQAEALAQSPFVLAGLRNLVYSAPTSAGKTMVADILLLKTLLGAPGGGRPGKKALIILPYVAIAAEKVFVDFPMLLFLTLTQLYTHLDRLAEAADATGGQAHRLLRRQCQSARRPGPGGRRRVHHREGK